MHFQLTLVIFLFVSFSIVFIILIRPDGWIHGNGPHCFIHGIETLLSCNDDIIQSMWDEVCFPHSVPNAVAAKINEHWTGRSDWRVEREREDKWVKKRNENIESIGKDKINWEKSIFFQFAAATLLFIVFCCSKSRQHHFKYYFFPFPYIGWYWDIVVERKANRKITDLVL